MIIRTMILSALCAAAVFSSGCRSLFRIDLTVVGERTALERQVLGTYEELGRDLTTYASVRGVQPDGSLQAPPPATDSQRLVLQAINNRRYNRDDLNTLLTNGVVGEANDGMLALLDMERLGNLDLSRDLVQQVIDEENRDREVIMERLMKTTPGVTENQRSEVAWIFATLNQDLAPEDSPIQTREGEWERK
jgi:hypothetical protein